MERGKDANSLTELSTYISSKTGGTRSGVLSFRTQRMTLQMLEAFRKEVAHITLTLLSTHELSEGVPCPGAQFYPQANEFVQLTMKVTNLTCMFQLPEHSGKFVLSYKPSSASSLVFAVDLETTPLEYVLHEGVLTDLPIGRLQSGESREITTSLCFLTAGRFEISAQARGFGAYETDNRQTRTYITAVVGRE